MSSSASSVGVLRGGEDFVVCLNFLITFQSSRWSLFERFLAGTFACSHFCRF
jgi:hypothetical protein